MHIIAESRSITVSPRKVRLVADSARKLPLEQAIIQLSSLRKRAAAPLVKTMKSAIANAVNNAKLERSTLRLKTIEVMEGPVMKRYHPSTRGRIHPYIKQTTHIRVILESVEEPKETKSAKKIMKKEEE